MHHDCLLEKYIQIFYDIVVGSKKNVQCQSTNIATITQKRTLIVYYCNIFLRQESIKGTKIYLKLTDSHGFTVSLCEIKIFRSSSILRGNSNSPSLIRSSFLINFSVGFIILVNMLIRKIVQTTKSKLLPIFFQSSIF